MYDVVVVGLGGMGSAAAAHLAKRGKRVLGLEQFVLGHELGSSAGRTRIIRKAYFEDVAYIPLLERAYELWRELERETDGLLLDLVGTLVVGTARSGTLDGVRLAVERYGIGIQELTRAQTTQRFPQTRLLPDEIGLLEPEAGIVFPERGIAAHQHLASRLGAQLRGNVRVIGWQRNHAGTLCIELDGGETVEAEELVLCAGPWLSQIGRELGLPLSIQRNTQIWFTPATSSFARGRLPTFFLESRRVAQANLWLSRFRRRREGRAPRVRSDCRP